MNQPEPVATHRPLLSRGGLLGLIGGALLLLLVPLPFAWQRLQHATQLTPSALSLSYLRLSLDKHPKDRALRLELVGKLMQAGQYTQARAQLLPVLAESTSLDARLLLIEIDRSLWLAIAAPQRARRDRALSQLLDDMRSIQVSTLDPREAESFAQRYRELSLPRAVAEILDALARRGLPDSGARVAAADAAWLEAGMPLSAAELHAWRAEQQGQLGGLEARLAVERARAAASPEAVDAMWRRMRVLYPDDVALLEQGVSLAEEHDIRRAFDLASQLTQRYPQDARYHRNLARLAEATGHSLRALDEYVWLVRHGGSEQDRVRALALARSNWDLPLVRELSEGVRAPKPPRVQRNGRPRCQVRPSSHATRRLREHVALYEALGDVAAARQKLTAAVESSARDERDVWQQKFELELRVGDASAASATLAHMVQRFPNRALSERLADLELAQGSASAALQTLLAAPGPQDALWLRRVAQVAWQAGDIDAERSLYERLAGSDAATASDYQRLWELARDRASALRVALASYQRFGSPDMFSAALSIYRALDDEDEQLALLADAERRDSLTSRVSYWQTRITLHQRRAARALLAHDYALAKQELSAADALLERAPRNAPAPELYAQLRTGQHAQALALGLASDDQALIARGYRESQLSTRERVYVLNRLGRSDEAFALALEGARSRDSAPEDRAALEADARNLAAGRTRYVRGTGETLGMAGLALSSGGAALDYGSRAADVRGEASYTRYRPTGPGDSVPRELHDVSGQLQARIEGSALELGVRVRNEQTARPFGTIALRLGESEDRARLLMRVEVNDMTTESARLRAFGVRDAVSAETTLPFSKHYYFNARATAEAFYTWQQRTLLGTGLSLDAQLATTFALPGDLGSAALRVATRLAPRFVHHSNAVDPPAAEPLWLSHTSEWAGLGASLGRGKLDAPPLVGRQFCYIVDAAAGWLWPAADVGFFAQAGVGVSVLGADLLSIAGRAGNVVGSSSWSASVAYGFTFDR
jgi:hypothetical protein